MASVSLVNKSGANSPLYNIENMGRLKDLEKVGFAQEWHLAFRNSASLEVRTWQLSNPLPLADPEPSPEPASLLDLAQDDLDILGTTATEQSNLRFNTKVVGEAKAFTQALAMGESNEVQTLTVLKQSKPNSLPVTMEVSWPGDVSAENLTVWLNLKQEPSLPPPLLLDSGEQSLPSYLIHEKPQPLPLTIEQWKGA
mmetsp:Transcript_13543/g.21106  ORF Transcript_13543/g.21106 Transcript_13543/m.21106 type:complete len:197 (-) Transcript_13543:13646-14236(-)